MITNALPSLSKRCLLLAACLLVSMSAACGGPESSRQNNETVMTPVSLTGAARFASGPIKTACSNQKRRDVNVGQCGCVQAAADVTLTDAEQRKGARFFGDPELLQRIKLSDSPGNERFWDTWARFAETAEKLCRIN